MITDILHTANTLAAADDTDDKLIIVRYKEYRNLKECSKELTAKGAVELHKALWYKMAEIAENEKRFPYKDEAIAILGYIPSSVMNNCFLCHYAEQRLDELIRGTRVPMYREWCGKYYACNFCPARFIKEKEGQTGHIAPCTMDGSPFVKYRELQSKSVHVLTNRINLKKVVKICRAVAEIEFLVSD